MAVVGAGMLPITSREEKSVWVVSEEEGPRERVGGGFWGLDEEETWEKWRRWGWGLEISDGSLN